MDSRRHLLRPVALGLLPLVLVLITTPLMTASASGLASPSANVMVSIDRMVYPDGLYRADFATTGACAPASDAVQVLAASCGDPAAANASSGTVRMVKLGFDASRRVEAVSADAPLLETRQAAASEQFDRVIVRLAEEGDLRIEISGSPADGLDPQPVAGSASSGGTIAGRSAIWTVPNAAPGTHEFSVRFSPGAPDGFAGTYVPRVTVTRTASGDRLLDHVGAPPPPVWPVMVQRTSTLVMAQHVAPTYGPPVPGTEPFVATTEPLPAAWSTEAWLDAAGTYNSAASGVVSASSVGRIEEIAPEAKDVVNVAGITVARPSIPRAEKIREFIGIDSNPDTSEILGFDHTVSTASPTTLENPPEGPLAGTFWDGDAAIVGSVAGIGEVSGDRAGPPTSDTGTIAADWAGNASVAWSGLWANNLPSGEPNALNYARYLRDAQNAVLDAAGYEGGYGPYSTVVMTEASIPVVARGGDIDNREGSLRDGDVFTVGIPQGHTFAGALTFTVWMPETNYKYKQVVTGGDLTITPQIGSGGIWMESSRSGYDRDWANLHIVTLLSREYGREFDGGLHIESAVAVPLGARGALDVIAADGRALHRKLSPGLWRVMVTPQGLRVTSLGAGRPA